jgi:hypothetical protein
VVTNRKIFVEANHLETDVHSEGSGINPADRQEILADPLFG